MAAAAPTPTPAPAPPAAAPEISKPASDSKSEESKPAESKEPKGKEQPEKKKEPKSKEKPKKKSSGPRLKQPSVPAGGGSSFSVMDVWNPTPTQTFVLGAGLIVLNFVTQSDLSTVLDRLWHVPKSSADVQKQTKFSKQSLLQLGGEAVFVLALSFVTGLSPVMGRAVMLFLLALYLVWLVHNGTKLTNLSIFGGSGNTLPGATGGSKS